MKNLLELKKVTVQYILEGDPGDFIREEMFECELPPEGRIIIAYGIRTEVVSVEHNLDNATAKIYLSKD